MLSPSFLPAGGLKFANMATFQAFTPQALPVVKMRNPPPHCTVEDADLSPELPFRFFFSSKTSLCSSVDEEQKIFLGKRKQKKGQGRSHLWKAEGGSHNGQGEMGTGLRSGTARFLMGSLPSAPWEVRSSALQSHQGHHLLQLDGQPLFPGSIILLQRTHNLPQRGKHTWYKKTGQPDRLGSPFQQRYVLKLLITNNKEWKPFSLLFFTFNFWIRLDISGWSVLKLNILFRNMTYTWDKCFKNSISQLTLHSLQDSLA